MRISGERFLVLGLGRAGSSVARFLLSRGAEVVGYDDDPEVETRDGVRQLKGLGLITARDLAGEFRLVITSPGFGPGSPVIRELTSRGYEVVDELEFASQFISGELVGVTGTNGKSTTLALLARMFGPERRIFFGGNLAPGQPLSEALFDRYDLYLVEVSSFQLERCRKFHPRVGVLLNLAQDHLDRHGSLKVYWGLKLSLFKNQGPEDYGVVNWDDPEVRARTEGLRSRVIPFSLRGKLDSGGSITGQEFCFFGEPVCPVSALKLPGEHNRYNALAALTVAKLLGASNLEIDRALRGFSGLPHRLEPVGVRDGVEYINSSMCTNPAGVVVTLRALSGPVVLICGGKEKGADPAPLVEEIRARVRWTILMGENRTRLAWLLRAQGYSQFDEVEELGAAVRLARVRARPGDKVLFAPGFASFDQFRDFQVRGEAFRNAVRDLEGQG